MLKKLVLLSMALGLLGLMAGCSDNATGTEDNTSTLNLESEFGGYTATSEVLADADLINEEEGTREFDDPMLSLSSVDSVMSDVEAGYYHFRAVWGQLCYDSTFITPTDWTGSLTISSGVEVLRRVIRFEPRQDYILERTDPKLIEWVSITTVHNDGISVDILIPPIRPEFDTTFIDEVDSLGNTSQVMVIDTILPEPEPVKVSFETGPYSRTFSLSDLENLDTIVTLDDFNSVAFQAIKTERIPCPRGFLSGHWGVNEEGEQVFRGKWMSRHGFIEGYLKGHYGENEAGEKVFFGKWVSKSGRFEGFLKGKYGLHPNYHADPMAFHRAGGWFAGHVFSATRVEIGRLKGKFRLGFDDSPGYFQGHWKLYCYNLESNSDGDGNNGSTAGYEGK